MKFSCAAEVLHGPDSDLSQMCLIPWLQKSKSVVVTGCAETVNASELSG